MDGPSVHQAARAFLEAPEVRRPDIRSKDVLVCSRYTMMASHYQFSAFSYFCVSGPSCFLTSRENGLVTIYSVDTTAQTVHSMGNAPQILRTLPACSKRRGCGFFQHPCSELPTDFAFLELSDRGAVYSTQVLVEDEPSSNDITQSWTPEEEELSTDGAVAAARMRKGGLGREWSSSVEALEVKEAIETAKPAAEAWSEREKFVVDFREIYKGAPAFWTTLATSTDQKGKRRDTYRVFVDGGSGPTGYGECLPSAGAHAPSLARS